MIGRMANLVVVLGNGLSVAANERLGLEALTQSFLEARASDRDALDRLLAEVDLGAVDPERDFEGIVAGLESAEEVVRAFVQLATGVPHPDLQEAAAILRDRGVTSLIRRLYYAYCAEVLDAIGELTRGDLAEPVVRFGDWLKAMYEVHGTASIFTLNYDLLLERALIDDNVLGLRNSVTDFFSGLPERSELLPLGIDGTGVRGLLYYPADPPVRPIHLHHLHGCLTHFRDLSTNSVFKIAAADLRGHDIFDRLASAEESRYVPSVILGSRKVEKSREWPFSQAFVSLEAAARSAATVVIAGYSFRDAAVNALLHNLVVPEKRWIVIDHRNAASTPGFIALAHRIIGDVEIEFALDGVGGALPDVS
jgi:SIR2-like domain